MYNIDRPRRVDVTVSMIMTSQGARLSPRRRPYDGTVCWLVLCTMVLDECMDIGRRCTSVCLANAYRRGYTTGILTFCTRSTGAMFWGLRDVGGASGVVG